MIQISPMRDVLKRLGLVAVPVAIYAFLSTLAIEYVSDDIKETILLLTYCIPLTLLVLLIMYLLILAFYWVLTGKEFVLKRMEIKMTTQMQDAAFEFAQELARARIKFPPMASAHEGYAVILEEFDELWEIVKQKQSERDYADMRKEVVQLGAMVLAFLTEIVDTENRR